MKEIFPVFDQLMSKQDKEKLLNQNAHVFWLTGLSGSGKTTIAKNLEKKLYRNGFLTQIIYRLFVNVSSANLVNLITKKNDIPEFLFYKCNYKTFYFWTKIIYWLSKKILLI